jgi:hypothetical protein
MNRQDLIALAEKHGYVGKNGDVTFATTTALEAFCAELVRGGPKGDPFDPKQKTPYEMGFADGYAKKADERGSAEPDMRAVCEALGFDPTNHHNAAKCPYCREQRAEPLPELVVTRDGKVLTDQRRGLQEFMERCEKKEPDRG